MTILVTGGAGFIGSNFVRHRATLRPDAPIYVLDSLTYAGNVANLDGLATVELLRASIGDRESVVEILRSRDIDTIVHFAAESHVDRSIEGPELFVETNVVGTHALLTAAREVWLQGSPRKHRFHHVSTDEVFGSLSLDDPPFSEATPYAPNSPYAASKAASDHLVRAYQRTYGLSATISNCSNNYGPYHFPEKLIPLFLTNMLRGRPLPIYGNGKNRRDWLYVADHCAAIELILANGRDGETYAVGGGLELTNVDVIDALAEQVDARFAADPALAARFPDCPAARGLHCDSLKTTVPDRLGHDLRYAIDGRKLEDELGYRPQWTFAAGLSATIDWYLANEDWWQSVLDGTYRALNGATPPIASLERRQDSISEPTHVTG